MIRTLAVTKDMKLLRDIPLKELKQQNIMWYWVDFDTPSENESEQLEKHFHFHQLSIEDCLHVLQRPKLDMYKNHSFFVLHALEERGISPLEVDIFLGNNFVVSFHHMHLAEIDEVWSKITTTESLWDDGSIYVFYQILDKLVDYYFPAAYKLEDLVNEIDENENGESLRKLLDKLFGVRSDLLRLRRIITQMRDLVYRMLSSEFLGDNHEKHVYFSDVYDHLLRLYEIIQSCYDISSEIRDSYLSLNSYRMNRIMMLLTVITTIFIPLTFIVGVYGMNFEFIPELKWRYGYYIVMGGMAVIAIFMYNWFKKKGWFDID